MISFCGLSISLPACFSSIIWVKKVPPRIREHPSLNLASTLVCYSHFLHVHSPHARFRASIPLRSGWDPPANRPTGHQPWRRRGHAATLLSQTRPVFGDGLLSAAPCRCSPGGGRDVHQATAAWLWGGQPGRRSRHGPNAQRAAGALSGLPAGSRRWGRRGGAASFPPSPNDGAERWGRGRRGSRRGGHLRVCGGGAAAVRHGHPLDPSGPRPRRRRSSLGFGGAAEAPRPEVPPGLRVPAGCRVRPLGHGCCRR